MSEGIPTGNTAPGLTAVVALFLVWSTLTYAARCWMKLRRSDGWNIDDTVISIAFLVVIFRLIAECQAVKHGYGNPWPSISAYDQSFIEKTLYASQILYIIALGLTRISAGFFSARMTRDKWHVRLTHSLIALSGVWAIVSVLVICLRGELSAPWTTKGDGSLWIRWLSVEITGLALELAFWASSVYGIAVLHMSLSKKLSIQAIFSIRLAIIPVVALRLVYLSPKYSTNIPVPSITVSVYTEITVQLAFMLASAIRLKPFLKPFHPGFVVQAANQRGSMFPPSGKSVRGDSYYMLSGAGSGRRTPIARKIDPQATYPRLAVPTPTFSPQGSSYKATISADEKSRQNSIVRADQNIIAVRETWSVTVEEHDEEYEAARRKEKEMGISDTQRPNDDEIDFITVPMEEHDPEAGSRGVSRSGSHV